ncbi:hypothetical protein Agub_g164, partial [Astrephomene gubernaculifera]
LIGSLLLAAGYLGLYSAASGGLTPAFGLVCCFAVLAGNSSTWFDTTCIVTNVRNFPRDRGTVVGILKAFVGLSASIFSAVYAAAFAPAGPQGAVRFLAFLGCVPPLLTAGLTAAINLVPEAYHEPQPPQQQQQQQAEEEEKRKKEQQQQKEGKHHHHHHHQHHHHRHHHDGHHHHHQQQQPQQSQQQAIIPSSASASSSFSHPSSSLSFSHPTSPHSPYPPPSSSSMPPPPSTTTTTTT